MIEVTSKESQAGAKILVVGVGGAGNNAVNRMIDEEIKDVEYVGINTDEQVLQACKAERTISIGNKVTGGKGAGGIPEIGAQAAEESADEITSALEGYDMVFITAGMGGGTGTGAAPVVARIAKEMGILTVAIVSKPFPFEQKIRMEKALSGLELLKENVDTLIVIPNEKLLQICDKKISIKDALLKADEVLQQAVQGITDLINIKSDFNLDFADVCSVMRNKGIAHIGIGVGRGDDKALEAAKIAVQSPLLETTIADCTDIILNVTGDLSLMDAQIASEYVEGVTGDGVNVILGIRTDESMEDTCVVTLIATGIEMPVTVAGRITSPSNYKPNAQAVRKPMSVPAGMGGYGLNEQPMNTGVGMNAGYSNQGGYMDEPEEFENTAPIPRKPIQTQPIGSANFTPRQKAKTEFSMPTFMKRDKND